MKQNERDKLAVRLFKNRQKKTIKNFELQSV